MAEDKVAEAAAGGPGSGSLPLVGPIPGGVPVSSGDLKSSRPLSALASIGLAWSRREVRRCSEPSRAQQLWDAITAVRAQKQIPAITRMSRYMNRFYQVNKGMLIAHGQS